MLVSVFPPLEGVAAERFLCLARLLEDRQSRGDTSEFSAICSNEANWCKNHPHLGHSRDVYEAATRVLIDLARLSWEVRQTGYGVELVSPVFRPDRRSTPVEIASQKQAVRAELKPLREAQFRDPAVRKFIDRLEHPRSTQRKSILNLIADGHELSERLRKAARSSGPARTELLRDVVKPYLQLVQGDRESTVFDEFTGLPLGDIWRYFRYTWSLPHLGIPGRQLLYLVRDAGHPSHAVMGIAALSNCAVQMEARDDYIGWTFASWLECTRQILQLPEPGERLEERYAELETSVRRAIEDIEPEGLATDDEIDNPNLEIVARLRRNSEEFARLREDSLRDVIDSQELPVVLQECEPELSHEYVPPVDGALLALENRRMANPALQRSRRMLVAKKRAFELGRLLSSRHYLNEYRECFLNPETTTDALRKEEFQIAVNTALTANKSARIGNNLLELTTCGAIPPYNELLAGKLTALLVLSPEVSDDYQRRYGGCPSIISSQLKNKEVIRDCRLAYIGTTSLYGSGSSQYNRLKLPAGVISPEQAEIRYSHIGYTSGYGTVQFSPETVRAIETVLEKKLGYQQVNSIFGEGPSPRLRKLRSGLQEIGFDPEALMRHNQHRQIFAVPLFGQAREFLCGQTVSLPDYVRRPADFRAATESISEFWRGRWLAKRIDGAERLELLANTRSWALSEEIPLETSDMADELTDSVELTPSQPRSEAGGGTASCDDAGFWPSIACAGSSVCSDELNNEQLERLHVPRPLESFIIDKVSQGYSIVLTGNAGDGKTHLLRRLGSDLSSIARVQPDATAAMRQGRIEPILEEWHDSLEAGLPYCLAANEYPLYELRLQGSDTIPQLLEVDRQCRQRLAYGSVSDDEDARDQVLVIDLSLRNPLHPDFSGAMLNRLLTDPALSDMAAGDADSSLARNYRRLQNDQVRQRLLELFRRIVLMGYRCPVREVWIILARLLFGTRPGAGSATSVSDWYSERLFESDDRFLLCELLRQYCDPSRFSHPQWDLVLEQPGATVPSDWQPERREPLVTLQNDIPARFTAVKRAFYFEHVQGEEVFALEDRVSRDYRDLLNGSASPDETIKKELIRAINLCYCPLQFSGIEERLYLWIGHRYHEKPTKSYISNQAISSTELEIVLPHLPRRIEGAFDFCPDHFLLRLTRANGSCSLRVDHSLLSTLRLLGEGLPRHLVPDRDINRLDMFLEELQAMAVDQERVFVCFNAEHRLGARVRLSTDYHRYEEANELE